MRKIRAYFGDWLDLPNGWRVRVIPASDRQYTLLLDTGPRVDLKPEGIDTAALPTQECRDETNPG